MAVVRDTRQKRAVQDLLAQLDSFTSAQDLHARLRAGGAKVGLTTVYTQLRALADAGLVDSVRRESGEVLYRRCGSSTHHHHLRCRGCGRAVEVDLPELEAGTRALGTRHGFRELDHVLEISGLCRDCPG